MSNQRIGTSWILLLAFGLVLFTTWRFGCNSQAASQSGSVGRYTIVNGTPSMARNIMLLDTITGATWLVCGDPKGEANGWCPLSRSFSAGAPNKD